jgi:hypothetical protein
LEPVVSPPPLEESAEAEEEPVVPAEEEPLEAPAEEPLEVPVVDRQ